MSNTVFKRLFEVQILHDYFLTEADGTSFFDKNKANKNASIIKKQRRNLYDVKQLIKIEPIGSTSQYMREYKLIISKSSLGFSIAIEVSPEDQAGEIIYKPRIEMDNSINLTFSIKPQVSFFNSITNLSLRPPLPAIYYFTNNNKEEYNETALPNYKSLPISAKAQDHQDGMIHEMGAIIDFSGTIKESILQTDGTNDDHWEEIDDRRFTTNADRVLLPNNFTYVTTKGQNTTQFSFVLEYQGGNAIKTISKNSTEPLANVFLNFTKVDETDEASDDILSGFYNLKVKENAGPEITYQIYLNNTIYNKNSLGIIDVRFDELDSPFSLLDRAGFIKARINSANEKISHPIFELRLKNRKTYWRYNKEGDFSDSEIDATALHLEHKPDQLISLKSKAITEVLLPFRNGSALMLPYPKISSLKVEKKKCIQKYL